MGYARPKGAWNTAFAEEVIFRRNEAGLPQREVIERTGLSRSTYTKFELDQVALTIDQIALIAAVLNVPVEDLARGARLRIEASEQLGVPIRQLRLLSASEGISTLLEASRRNPDLPSAPDEASHRKPWPGTHTPEAGTGALIEERDREIRRKQEEQSALHPDRSCL